MLLDVSSLPKTAVEILALDGDGSRAMPLVAGRCSSAEAGARLKGIKAAEVFKGSRSPEGTLAGLWVYFSAFAEAHGVAQDLGTAEGSYWHAILHRQEPDAWNSGYWFRRVGPHPVYPKLATAAAQLGYGNGGGPWDPVRFVEYCEEARTKPGSATERTALDVQLAEWQLLFAWCAVRT